MSSLLLSVLYLVSLIILQPKLLFVLFYITFKNYGHYCFSLCILVIAILYLLLLLLFLLSLVSSCGVNIVSFAFIIFSSDIFLNQYHPMQGSKTIKTQGFTGCVRIKNERGGQ